MINKESLDLLAEAEKEFYQLNMKFEENAIKAVKTIVETQATPLNIINLYGEGGRKFTSGGMIFRHCDDWLFHKKYRLNKKQSRKMASQNLKAFSLLRHKFSRLLIPLGCIVEYHGEGFEVQSISPITINTLTYGSDTQGLGYSTDLSSEELAQGIAKSLNLKKHNFINSLEIDSKIIEQNIWLPYSVQLHRSQGIAEEIYYYIINPGSLLCCDTILQADAKYAPEGIPRQLRPEWMMNNSSDEIASSYIKQTWKNPTRGIIGGNFILEYEYYYYEK